MPRKPADSAYILALTLRSAWQLKEQRAQAAVEYNASVDRYNTVVRQNNWPESALWQKVAHEDVLFMSEVFKRIEELRDISEGLAIITDADYRAVIFDAVKQPFNRVRKSKGFQNLVPELNTLRRYAAYDENREMECTEEEARELADIIWAQEMEPFIEAGRGVDPINKQIIAQKVARELKEMNVKYVGEEIISVAFNDVELDLYECDHNEVTALLSQGIAAAYELFGFDPAAQYNTNFRDVRQNVLMYNSMFEKEMDDERLADLVDSIICCFNYFQQLIE